MPTFYQMAKKHLLKKKAKNKQKKIDKKLNEIKECIEKKVQKWKPIFKQIIISKNEMNKFEKEELK